MWNRHFVGGNGKILELVEGVYTNDGAVQRILGRDVRLVTAGHAVAATVQRTLESCGLESAGDGEGRYRFVCTGDVESFRELGTRFLQMPLGEIERVTL